MIKRAIKKRIIISFLTLFILSIIYLIPSKKEYNEEIVINNNINYVYLLNNEKLIRVSVISNNSDSIEKAKEVIDALTIDSKNSKYINNKLKPIIPKNTKVIDISLDKKILKINFNKEILNISKSMEEKLIESLIYSLTEIKNIDNIMIFVEGKSLLKLPHSNINLPILLNRDFGINKIYDITTLSNVSKFTLYYFTSIDDKYNAVPVTLFTNNNDEKIEVIIKKLKSSNIYQTNLVSFLSNNIKLLDYEIEENKVKLNFNQYLLDTFYQDSLIEEVKYAISKSIEETLNIKNVEILVNNETI